MAAQNAPAVSNPMTSRHQQNSNQKGPPSSSLVKAADLNKNAPSEDYPTKKKNSRIKKKPERRKLSAQKLETDESADSVMRENGPFS